MFVTSSDRCIKLTESGWQEIDDLQSTQEEADTRILLHVKHAAETIPALICITEDTDVFIICLGLCQDVNSNIFIRRGSKSSVRINWLLHWAGMFAQRCWDYIHGLAVTQ